MNEQEAIKIIEKDRYTKCDTLHALPENARKNAVELNDMIEAEAMAIIALSKQDARKVIYYDNCGNENPYQPRCPRCYEAISEPYYMNGESWCPYCGQHIDWTVEE